jgi:hypothetical protein
MRRRVRALPALDDALAYGASRSRVKLRAMRALAVAAVLCASVPANAEGERRTSVALGIVFGIHSVPDAMPNGDDTPTPAIARIAEGFGGPRLMLAFERAPLPYPDAPGYRHDGQLVPELMGGAFVGDDSEYADVMVGAGLRAELRISQREMGLLRISARMALYVAARGFVVGENRDPMGELVMGEYFLFGRTGSGRFGFEFGGMQRREDGKVEAQQGFISQLYLGGTL